MIWGEIPVSSEDQYRPYGWRNVDDHRTSRWTEKITLEEHEIHKDDEKFTGLLEEQIDIGIPSNGNEMINLQIFVYLSSIIIIETE